MDKLKDEYPGNIADIREVADKVVKEQLRDLIVTEGKRPDGRGLKDIRQISTAMSALLPRVHGSGLFTRGQTQVLTTLTLRFRQRRADGGYARRGRREALHALLQLPPLLGR